MKEGEQQAELLLSKHETYPNSVAMVLWGSDNIKSDGLSSTSNGSEWVLCQSLMITED